MDGQEHVQEDEEGEDHVAPKPQGFLGSGFSLATPIAALHTWMSSIVYIFLRLTTITFLVDANSMPGFNRLGF